jgi:fumarylpyruvate hydrolase
MSFAFPPPAPVAVAIVGRTERFPVHRIYCVGRNYAAHVREMGKDPDREPPFFFSKPADAVVSNGANIAFPTRTNDLHHEIELVVAIGKAGANIAIAHALTHVFGYAVGLDLTRRDLQAEAKDKGRPWDTAKGFDRSAPLSAITPSSAVTLNDAKIWLEVNGSMRQRGALADMIWSVPEIIAELSTLFELAPGDLIFTGTPAGVAAIEPGDRLEGGVDGLQTLQVTLV